MKSLIIVISGTFSQANSYLNENMKALVWALQLSWRIDESYRPIKCALSMFLYL